MKRQYALFVGVQKVRGSNPLGPTIFKARSTSRNSLGHGYGARGYLSISPW